MKRSEAAKTIEAYLNGRTLNWQDYGTDILDAVEFIGMLPPIEPGRTVYDLDLGVPEWELEDE